MDSYVLLVIYKMSDMHPGTYRQEGYGQVLKPEVVAIRGCRSISFVRGFVMGTSLDGEKFGIAADEVSSWSWCTQAAYDKTERDQEGASRAEGDE